MVQADEFGDPRSFIRRQQQRFFRAGSYSPQDMASQIAAEAVLAGARDVHVSVGDEWIVIQADIDWLAGVEGDPFSSLTIFPPGGPGDSTREILAVTFSRGVVTASKSGVRVIKGDMAGPVKMAPARGRVLAFMVDCTY
ncbi:hypothetical protein ACFWVC_11850 [Streptomyces sp. NPDC058691]|uniref:hypothetical protein n=1 Tax=Streptomyces sp. NPDC058691 TaxID=3346601 RepID=UPI003649A378